MIVETDPKMKITNHWPLLRLPEAHLLRAIPGVHLFTIKEGNLANIQLALSTSKHSPRSFMGSSILGKFTHPQINSFQMHISQGRCRGQS